jgi:glycerophosphoryl diester phosphodiesterase
MKTFSRPGPRALVIGHRGAAALGEENSLGAIEAALAAGVDGVELDVVLANRRLWLAHSLVELRRASPTLDEGLAFLADREVLVVLDVKAPGFEEQVVAALKEHDLVDRALLSSFFPGVLRAVRQLEPSLKRGLSYPNDRTGLGTRVPDAVVHAGLAALRGALAFRIARMLRSAEAEAAVLHHLVVSDRLTARCRELDAPVLAWTVNDGTAARRAERLRVDAIITDDPLALRSSERSPHV